ncbi:MAG: hypothetical protein P8J87_13625 [Verrucomicrobiales bacterium]|nr:hypothetical protein [Verrucomicrobiales bacterium]
MRFCRAWRSEVVSPAVTVVIPGTPSRAQAPDAPAAAARSRL